MKRRRPNGDAAVFEPPRPGRAAAVFLAPVPLPALLYVSGAMPRPAALVLTAAFVVLALPRIAVDAYDLHRTRRLGEALLLDRPAAPPAGLAAWRSAELTSPRSGRRLRRLAKQLRLEIESCARLHPPPLDRSLLEASATALQRLERRLDALSEPVSPLGMIDVHGLVLDVDPFDFPELVTDLPVLLDRSLARLEPT